MFGALTIVNPQTGPGVDVVGGQSALRSLCPAEYQQSSFTERRLEPCTWWLPTTGLDAAQAPKSIDVAATDAR